MLIFQSLLISRIHWYMVLQVVAFSWLLIQLQTLSFGFKSDLLPGHEGDVGPLLETLHDDLFLLAWGPILENMCYPVETNEQLQLVI
jgi:hypothetical protein